MAKSKNVFGLGIFVFLLSVQMAAGAAGLSQDLNEAQAYKEIEGLFLKNAGAEAQTKVDAFLLKYPKSQFAPSVENIQGLIFLKNKDPSKAADAFKKAIDPNASQPKFNQYILYNLATAQLEAGQVKESDETLGKIQPEDLDQPTRAKYAVLKSKIDEKKREQKKAEPALVAAGLAGLPSPRPSALSPDLSVITNTLPAVDLTSIAPLNPHAVGVLLPVKGKLGRFGTKSLQAIQLAFDLLGPGAEDSSKLSLVVEDSGDTPEQAVRALDRLVVKHGVVAVIGPMLTKGIDQVTARAQQLNVPLISLARRAGIGAGASNIFQGGLVPSLQAQGIARNAVEKLGLKRFAIVYPNEKIGVDLALGFWNSVEALGAKVVDVQSYNSGQVDFRNLVDRLSGLFYPEARQAELDKLAHDRDLNKITKRSRRTEQYFHLNPIVDFDAVFIADDPGAAALIIPTFAYRDVENVKFLGTSSWDSPDFVSRTQGYSQGAYFVDAFFSGVSSGKGKKFLVDYREIFHQEPSSMEAIAYDAGLVMRHILKSHSSPSRSDVKDDLRSLHDFPGATGLITYENGDLTRPLKLITVKSGQFVEVKD